MLTLTYADFDVAKPSWHALSYTSYICKRLGTPDVEFEEEENAEDSDPNHAIVNRNDAMPVYVRQFMFKLSIEI